MAIPVAGEGVNIVDPGDFAKPLQPGREAPIF